MELENDMVRKCRECGEVKSLNRFNKTRWGGYTAVCVECSTKKRLATMRQSRDVSSERLGSKKHYTRGKDCRGVSDSRFDGFTSRELLVELQARGYKWSDLWLERVEVIKARVRL